VSARTLACTAMVLDVALCIRCTRIDGTWIDASAIQAGHVRRTLRVAFAYRANLFVHCKYAQLDRLSNRDVRQVSLTDIHVF